MIPIDRARRIALAAQGFADARVAGRVDRRHFRRVVDRVKVVQLDSVNAFSRTHYMPFFSRLGPFDRPALDKWLWGSGEMFEYWAHEASLVPATHHHLFRWRMEGGWHWGRVERLRKEQPGYLEDVLRQVAERGPLRTSDLDQPGERDAEAMWGWNDGKVALEALFLEGKVTAADRPNFVRLYDLPDRVLDKTHLEVESSDREEAMRRLLDLAGEATGVATADDLADYYRLKMPQARPRLAELVADGVFTEVEVEGWDRPGYLHRSARVPRRVQGAALLSPFDSLVWYRPRLERLWDFHYRIEIYVPAAQRVYGYYVLPLLLDGDMVARVDLKTDRQNGVLRVRGAYGEPGIDHQRVASVLLNELRSVAGWLEMDDVVVDDRGDLAPVLRGSA